MTENDSERNYPREHRCPGCGRWGFEITFSSNDLPRCSVCGEQISNLDSLDSRPENLYDRIGEEIRHVVREEIRRESIGARCPVCAESDLGFPIEEIDQMMNDSDEWVLNCPSCGCSGPPERFDPLNDS